MEAQGQRKETVFCEKCYTVVPKGSEFCENCGASLSRAPGAEGSDGEVYPELARANLLRMRKSYKEAEDICLAILRRYPHNLSANALLGDISVEENNLKQAVEWYELALDIEPDSQGLHDKLEAAKGQMQSEVAATTAEQLGLPIQKPKTWLIVALAILIILVIAIGAYVASQQSNNGNRLSQSQIDQPVVLGSDESNPSQNNPPAPDPNKPNPPAVQASEDDQKLTHLLASKTADGAYVIQAQFDPAISGISVTYMVPSEQNERKIGANLASEAFGIVKDNFNQDISQIELRAIRGKNLYYSAVVRKDDYETTQDPTWQTAHQGDSDAMMKAILSDEKYASDDNATDGGTGGNGESGSKGSTEGQTGSSTAGTTGSETGSQPGGGSSTGSAGSASSSSSPTNSQQTEGGAGSPSSGTSGQTQTASGTSAPD